jgi:hypothetical protein
VRRGSFPSALAFGALGRRGFESLSLRQISISGRSSAISSSCRIRTLRDRELADVGKASAEATGLTHRPAVDGQRISGIYRRSVTLASGRFAMLDDGWDSAWYLERRSLRCDLVSRLLPRCAVAAPTGRLASNYLDRRIAVSPRHQHGTSRKLSIKPNLRKAAARAGAVGVADRPILLKKSVSGASQ